jgi:hypothetical protein
LALVLLAALLFLPFPIFAQSPAAAAPAGSGLTVTPTLIDFGRIRTNSKQHDTSFTIENTGAFALQLRNTDYKSQLTATNFAVKQNPTEGQTIAPSTLITINVSYFPFAEGPQTGTITIESSDPARPFPKVTLRATGVTPHVGSRGLNFGPLRVGDISPLIAIPIYNYGSDSTRIDSVVIKAGSDIPDFSVKLDSFPPRRLVPLHIGYERTDSLYIIQAAFAPKSLGSKRMILDIYTADSVLHDTLTGKGVEPLVTVAPSVIDFGTDTVRKIGDPNPTPTQFTLPFTVVNGGGFIGHLLRIAYHDSVHFQVRLDKPSVDLDEYLQPGDTVTGTVQFNVLEEGDFEDTVTITNDTRYALYSAPYTDYQPSFIIRAKVRTGRIDSAFVHFSDTIRTCDTNRVVLVIHNPYPVEVHIDSIRFANLPEDTLGFRLGAFGFPINIAPDSTFGILLEYAFPDELLNGDQTLSLILYQRQGGGQPAITRRVTASLVRERRTLTLNAVLPNWISSASDIDPMRLPITLHGPRANVGELDSFTLALQFSNDLFMPVGIDDSKSLIAPLSPDGSVTTSWDQSTRTFRVTVTGARVSDPSRLADSLLMTVILRAFLTTDSEVTVTPTFTFKKHPCAYNLQPFTLSIPYANECGEPVIREFMATGSTPAIDVIAIGPNPLRQGEPLTISTEMARAGTVEIQVSDALGRVISERSEARGKGRQIFSLPSASLPSSGTAFITLTVKTSNGARGWARKQLKIAISD